MAVTKAGTRLVVEDYAAFIQQMNAANAALVNFNNTLSRMGTQGAGVFTSFGQTAQAGLGQIAVGSQVASAQFSQSAQDISERLAQMQQGYDATAVAATTSLGQVGTASQQAATVVAQTSTAVQQSQQGAAIASHEMAQAAIAAGAAMEQVGGQSSAAYQQFMQQAGVATGQTAASMQGLSAAAQQLQKDWSLYIASEPKLNVDQWNRLASAVSQMDTTTTGFIGQFRDMVTVLEAENKALDQNTKGFELNAAAMNRLGLAMLALGAATQTALVAAGLQASRIKELEILLEVTRVNAIAAAEAEAELAEQGRILTDEGLKYVGVGMAQEEVQKALAKASALNATAVQQQVQGIRDLHLSGQIANNTVATLIRYNLDWTKSTQLARLAQDAATFAMQDSSVALQGLINGITTLQPRTLRTYGIMVNLEIAYEKWALANDRAVESMTVTERQQAALNEVLAQAPSIAGAYEAAMGTASKQLRSIKTDTVNLAEAYGQFLEPALTTAIGGFREMLQWLTDLPSGTRETITEMTAFGTALLLAVGGATKLNRMLQTLTETQSFLAATTAIARAATAAFLGPAGIAVLIGGIALLGEHVKNLEKQHQQEAAAILDSSANYNQYIVKMEAAGLAAYALSENLYAVARAAGAADEGLDALELGVAAQRIEKVVEQTAAFAPGMHDWGVSAFTAQDMLEGLIDGLSRFIDGASDAELAVLQDADTLRTLGRQYLDTEVDVAKFTQTVIALTEAQQKLRTENENDSRLIRQRLALWEYQQKEIEAATIELDGWSFQLGKADKAATQYEDGLRALQTSTENLRKAEKAAFEQNVRLAEQRKQFADDVFNAEQDAIDKVIDAEYKRNRDLEDLDYDYQQKAIDAWEDYQQALAETEGDLAKFHAGTLDDLLDLDRDFLEKRNDAWVDYQQDLVDAERDMQRDIEDANLTRLQKLEDAERDYARDLEDARRDLAQDLEDDAEEHAQNLLDIEQERQDAQLQLETEYQDKLYEIQNLAQQRLLDLAVEYEEKGSDVRLKYLRQALEQLEGYRYWNQDFYETLLRDIFKGELPADVTQLPMEFRSIYEKMLEELAKLDDDRIWEEEDLSDDIVREQEKRLQDLETWLQEEQAAIEAAAVEKAAKEQERYAGQREERQRQYTQDLEDLELARQREREAIERDHQRKLADIATQAERERQAIAEQYAQRLVDLEVEYDREKLAIQDKLEEQNQAARDKYDEALRDIATAKEKEREEINRQYDRTLEDIQADLAKIVFESAAKYNQLPEAMQPAYDKMRSDARAQLITNPDSLVNIHLEAVRLIQAAWQSQSPSRVMMELAESLQAGWEKGLDTKAASDSLLGAFGSEALQANLQAAVGDMNFAMPAMPAIQQATLPPMMGQTSYSSTQHLSVSPIYNQYQSESSLRQDLAGWMMAMKYARR